METNVKKSIRSTRCPLCNCNAYENSVYCGGKKCFQVGLIALLCEYI